MFPISDTNPTKSFPFFNYIFITVNIIIFFYQIFYVNTEQFIYRYGFIPGRFSFYDYQSYIRIITSFWLHGGWFHILSNLWFLHLFGDNVEDRLGHIKYLVFYFLAGIISVFAQYMVNTSSNIPLIGASGAISGVTGAYFIFFKRAKIKALIVTLFGFWNIITLPAWFFLGYWFVVQIFSGLGSIASINYASGGIAFFAHIGGFIFGYFFAKQLVK